MFSVFIYDWYTQTHPRKLSKNRKSKMNKIYKCCYIKKYKTYFKT